MRCKASDCFTCPYPDCINDADIQPFVSTDGHRASSRKAMAKMYQKRRDVGLCYRCGKRKPIPGHAVCLECKNRHTKQTRNRRRANGTLPRELLDGIERCAFCGDAPLAEGKKLCARCLENAREAAKKAREQKKITRRTSA